MTTILVAGSANFDIIAQIPAPPKPHEKLRVKDYGTSVGGAASNTARWLAHLGAQVQLVSAVGDNSFGSEVLRSLRSGGVGVDKVKVVDGEPTGVAVIMSTGQEKRMLTFPGPDRENAYLAVSESDLEAMTHLHVAGEPTDGLAHLIHSAHLANCSISIEWNGRDMSHLGQVADLNFMNADEAQQLMQAEDGADPAETARALAHELKQSVILTLGAAGALHCSPDGAVTTQRTEQIMPVDRTGGGDAFDAGYIAKFTDGGTPRDCLDLGLKTARSALTILGACP